jgi:hypothetical protein
MPPTLDTIYPMFTVVMSRYGIGAVVECPPLPTNVSVRKMTRHFIDKTVSAHKLGDKPVNLVTMVTDYHTIYFLSEDIHTTVFLLFNVAISQITRNITGQVSFLLDERLTVHPMIVHSKNA